MGSNSRLPQRKGVWYFNIICAIGVSPLALSCSSHASLCWLRRHPTCCKAPQNPPKYWIIPYASVRAGSGSAIASRKKNKHCAACPAWFWMLRNTWWIWSVALFKSEGSAVLQQIISRLDPKPSITAWTRVDQFKLQPTLKDILFQEESS